MGGRMEERDHKRATLSGLRPPVWLVITSVLVLLPLTAFLVGRPHPLEPADFTFVLPEENTTFDPAKAATVSDGWLIQAMFEGLMLLDPVTMEPIPGAAERYEISGDGLTYTFHLRQGLRWSDGQALTANDFLFAWQRALDPATGCRFGFLLDGIQDPKTDLVARDSSTFVVRLRHPCTYFPALAAHFCLAPVREDQVIAFGDRWSSPKHLVSNGRYRLGLRRFKDRVRLLRNEQHPDAPNVALGIIDALVVESKNTALNMFLTGAVDWVNGAPPAAIPRLRGRPDVMINTVLATNFLRFNVTCEPLDDVRIRRALDMALDREALCRHIYRGGEKPAASLVPPSLPGYLPAERTAGGLEQARQLLADAGYPGGAGFPELELLHGAQELSRAVAEAIAAAMKERLGIRIRPAPQEYKVYIDSVIALRYQIALGMWIGDYVDPSTFLDLFKSNSGGNRTGWSSPEYDRLVESASEADTSDRMGLLREAEHLLLEVGPIAPICFRSQVNLLSEKVAGFSVNLLDLHPLDRLRIRGR